MNTRFVLSQNLDYYVVLGTMQQPIFIINTATAKSNYRAQQMATCFVIVYYSKIGDIISCNTFCYYIL